MHKTEVHPIEVAIVAALVVAESLLVLVVAGLALLLTLAQWRPAAAPAPVAEPEPIQAQPQLHPLALLATELQALPAVTLRQMAGVRSKAIRKAQLIELIACS